MKEKIAIVALIISLIAIGGVFLVNSQQNIVSKSTADVKHDINDATLTAELAMATSSLWMSERHLHELDEALKNNPVDWEEAEEETEELISWLTGATWPSAAKTEVTGFIDATKTLSEKLESKDLKASKSAYMAANMKYHGLHHEIMELVGGGHDEGDKH